jgi:hypothetical protein
MIKFTLIIWVCTFLGQNTCLPPVKSSTLYDSWYECSREAHKKSLKILSKIGYKEINQYKLGTRYTCTPSESI